MVDVDRLDATAFNRYEGGALNPEIDLPMKNRHAILKHGIYEELMIAFDILTMER